MEGRVQVESKAKALKKERVPNKRTQHAELSTWVKKKQITQHFSRVCDTRGPHRMTVSLKN